MIPSLPPVWSIKSSFHPSAASAGDLSAIWQRFSAECMHMWSDACRECMFTSAPEMSVILQRWSNVSTADACQSRSRVCSASTFVATTTKKKKQKGKTAWIHFSFFKHWVDFSHRAHELRLLLCKQGHLLMSQKSSDGRVLGSSISRLWINGLWAAFTRIYKSHFRPRWVWGCTPHHAAVKRVEEEIVLEVINWKRKTETKSCHRDLDWRKSERNTLNLTFSINVFQHSA